MTRIVRRVGVYSNDKPKVVNLANYTLAPKRRLPRRLAILGANKDVKDAETHNRNAHTHYTSTTRYRGRPSLLNTETKIRSTESPTQKCFGTSNSEAMIKCNENERSQRAVKGGILYLKPSSLDIIIGHSKSEEVGGTSIETYIKTLFADQYKESESSLEKSLIASVIHDSVKERGGKFLQEYSNKQRSYYEVDDQYSMTNIREILGLDTIEESI